MAFVELITEAESAETRTWSQVLRESASRRQWYSLRRIRSAEHCSASVCRITHKPSDARPSKLYLCPRKRGVSRPALVMPRSRARQSVALMLLVATEQPRHALASAATGGEKCHDCRPVKAGGAGPRDRSGSWSRPDR